jgi:hypothetical protein
MAGVDGSRIENPSFLPGSNFFQGYTRLKLQPRFLTPPRLRRTRRTMDFVPELSRFFRIVIRMFSEPGAPHHVPHFHAKRQSPEEPRQAVPAAQSPGLAGSQKRTARRGQLSQDYLQRGTGLGTIQNRPAAGGRRFREIKEIMPTKSAIYGRQAPGTPEAPETMTPGKERTLGTKMNSTHQMGACRAIGTKSRPPGRPCRAIRNAGQLGRAGIRKSAQRVRHHLCANPNNAQGEGHALHNKRKSENAERSEPNIG